MSRRYFLLVARYHHGWELVFGDYRRSVVRAEMCDQDCQYCDEDDVSRPLAMRIIETADDQLSIDRVISQLNEQPSRPARGNRGWVENIVL